MWVFFWLSGTLYLLLDGGNSNCYKYSHIALMVLIVPMVLVVQIVPMVLMFLMVLMVLMAFPPGFDLLVSWPASPELSRWCRWREEEVTCRGGRRQVGEGLRGEAGICSLSVAWPSRFTGQYGQ